MSDDLNEPPIGRKEALINQVLTTDNRVVKTGKNLFFDLWIGNGRLAIAGAVLADQLMLWGIVVAFYQMLILIVPTSFMEKGWFVIPESIFLLCGLFVASTICTYRHRTDTLRYSTVATALFIIGSTALLRNHPITLLFLWGILEFVVQFNGYRYGLKLRKKGATRISYKQQQKQ